MAPTPNQDSAQAWYLDIDGKPTGPYRLEQLKGFLEAGQIRPFHQVTAAHLNGQWISVHELFEAKSALSTTPAAAPDPGHAQKSAPFQPPPRPTDLDHTPMPMLRNESDPALSLFTALQASRDRRQNEPLPTLRGRKDKGGRGAQEDLGITVTDSSPRLLYIVAGLMGIGVVGYATMKFLSRPAETQVASKKSNEVVHPAYNPPVAPVAVAPAGTYHFAAPAPVSPIVIPPRTTPMFNVRAAPPPPLIHPAHVVRDDRDRDDRDRDDRDDRDRDDRDDRDREDLSGDYNHGVEVAPPAPASDSGSRGLEPAPNPRPVRPITIDPYNPDQQQQ